MPEVSHKQALADRSIAIMDANGVSVEVIRAVDHDIATGVWPDMTEHGWERDDWPAIHEKVMAADILVLTSPIWLGEKSSVCTSVEHPLLAAALGYVIPPQADSGWLGEAGPGPSYRDPGSGGPENDFTNRNTTFLTRKMSERTQWQRRFRVHVSRARWMHTRACTEHVFV